MTFAAVHTRDAGQLLARVLFGASMLLMPFSTGAQLGVFSFGLPFLGLLTLHYLMMQIANPSMSPWRRQISLYALLLIAAIAISSLYALAPFASFARLVPNVLGFFTFLLLISPFFGEPASHSTYEFTARMYVAGGALVAAYFLGNFAYAVSTIGVAAVFLDRVTGGVISLPWGATNVVASVLLFPLFLTFYFTNAGPHPSGKWWYLLARILMLAAIAVTLSRGAALSTAFGLVLLAFFFQGRARRRVIVFLLLATGAAWYVNRQIEDVMSQQLVSALVNRFQDSDVKDFNGRVLLWTLFGSAFLKAPLLGIGYYSSLYYFQASGHNIILTTLVERGLIGLGLSAVLPAKAGRTLVFGLRNAGDACTRTMFACMTAGGFASMLHLMIEDANFTQQYIVYSWVAFALVFQAVQVIRHHPLNLSRPLLSL